MRLKIIALALFLSTAITPPAHALSLGLLIGQAAFTLGASVAVTNAIIAGVSAIGGALITSALSFAVNLLLAEKPPTVKPEDVVGNFQNAEPDRFMLAGECRPGGNIIFAVAKDNRTLYKLVAHGDDKIHTELQLYLGDRQATIDPVTKYVNEPEFRYTGDPDFPPQNHYRLYLRDGDVNQPAQPILVNEILEWTVDHKGAGVCDTLLKLDPVKPTHRGEVLNNRGVLGVGEPDVSRAGKYGYYYDPRDAAQEVDDETTWGPNEGNPVLFWAHHRRHPERYNMDAEDIDWESVKTHATHCEEIIVDRYGQSVPRYKFGSVINKTQESNKQSEDRILASCDGKLIENENGLLGMHVGKYIEPDLILTDADIYDIESQTSEDGENVKTHYYFGYTEPEFDWKAQTGAPYILPSYTPGNKVKTTKLENYGVLHHNQGTRITKAAALRATEEKKLAVVTNLRGLRAKSRRFVRINSEDEGISGVFEVADTTDPKNGKEFLMILIKTDEGNWDLELGEEGNRPNFELDIETDATIPNIALVDMAITPVSISASGGISTVSFRASFVMPANRPELLAQVQFRIAGGTVWEDFSVRTEDLTGISSTVTDGGTYETRWRTINASGGGSEYQLGPNVVAVADQTLTSPPVINSSSSPSSGTASINFTAPPELNYVGTAFYRSNITPADFADASLVKVELGIPGQVDILLDTGLSADTYHYWAEAINGSSLPSTRVGPETIVVT